MLTAKPTYPSLMVALRDYFGQKPGQTLQEFAAECKSLTAEDKAWFQAEFERNGHTFTA